MQLAAQRATTLNQAESSPRMTDYAVSSERTTPQSTSSGASRSTEGVAPQWMFKRPIPRALERNLFQQKGAE